MKILAFYLPQFHQIPENDVWWGEGFTEWTNTKKTNPLFKNHYQPKIPLNKNYYDLSKMDTLLWQAELANKYGIHGFVFYHYWFKDGKKLLEKPAEMLLENKELKTKFCFSWANEPWSRRWDGSETEILMPQEYGEKKEWKMHFDYLLKFFKDSRYIFVNNKPLFIIYKPDLIPNCNEMMDYWDELALENNLNGITFISQHASFFSNKCKDMKFDYNILFEPGYTLITHQNIKNKKEKLKIIMKNPLVFEIKKNNFAKRFYSKKELNIMNFGRYNYDVIWKAIINRKNNDKKTLQGGFVDWDNSPRIGKRALVFHGSTPEKFQKYLSLLIKKLKKENKDLLFITAWNEWAEGSYLEPDEKHGYKYLEAVNNALIENGENNE